MKDEKLTKREELKNEELSAVTGGGYLATDTGINGTVDNVANTLKHNGIGNPSFNTSGTKTQPTALSNEQ